MPSASLVFHYFGEHSYLTRLAQDVVPLHKAFEGYDRRVLLHHPSTFGPFQMTHEAIKSADVVDTPTKEHLVEQLNDLGASGYETDLFIFSHGSRGCFLCSKGEYGNNDIVTDYYLEFKVRPLKLRAVWQVNCYGETLNSTWRKLGARVSAGARWVNFYPTRFNGFINYWNARCSFSDAVQASDTAEVHTPVQAYILVAAVSRMGEWEGSITSAPTVLGNNEASERYFRKCWLGDDIDIFLTSNISGKVVMNRSSLMIIGGNRRITKAEMQ